MAPAKEPGRELRIFFIPFFATGHIIPMVDAARLFAIRGTKPAMLVTPANATVIRPALDRANASGRPIDLLTYPFPSAAVDLPEGQENLSSVPLSNSTKIERAVPFVRGSLSRIIRENPPDCIIADIHFFWTTELAKELGIPRVVFNAIGVFSTYVMQILRVERPFMHVAGDEPFIVPDLPHQIEMVRHDVPELIRTQAEPNEFWKQAFQAQAESYGIIVNTFYELDSAYTHLFEKTIHRKAWYVGPLSLSYDDGDDAGKMARGGGEGKIHDKCMNWLETKKPCSVVFLCFGSWCHFSKEQVREIALGLQASGHSFLWVVREEDGGGTEWLPEGFVRRVEEKGLVLRGWAPQVLVLNHPAVGAFVTHCGWNSVLEGICAGVPMITWPLYFEQFINEKLVVQVMKIGVGLRRVVDGDGEVMVKGEEIAAAVAMVIGDGGETVAMKRRAGEYREMARRAVKDGGSSCNDLNRLIEELQIWHHQKEA